MLMQEQDVELKEKKKNELRRMLKKKSDKKDHKKQEMKRKEKFTLCIKIIQNYPPL